MHITGVATQDRSHARSGQPAGIRLPLVTERIEARGHDHRGGETAELGGQQGRDARVAPVLAGGQEVGFVPVHVRLREQEALGEQRVRRGGAAEFHGRVDQQLESRRRAAVGDRELGGNGREVPARAVACDRDSRRIDAELSSALDDVTERREGVLDGGGEGVLGGEPVVDAQHAGAGRPCKQPARLVVGIEVAGHPAAAVIEDDHRRRFLAGQLAG